jgi:hypothetical protein
VAFQRDNHVLFVQYFILRDQTARAFGEEDLVAELDRRLQLAAFDAMSMGLENRIDLLGSRNLLAIEHTAARLIDLPKKTPALGLTCWAFLLWLFQGKIARWQPTPVVARANGRSFSCCNFTSPIHRQPKTEQDRQVNTLRNPDACAANSTAIKLRQQTAKAELSTPQPDRRIRNTWAK